MRAWRESYATGSRDGEVWMVGDVALPVFDEDFPCPIGERAGKESSEDEVGCASAERAQRRTAVPRLDKFYFDGRYYLLNSSSYRHDGRWLFRCVCVYEVLRG